MIAFFRSRKGSFRARSAERDKETDLMNIARVTRAIDQAIASCEAERDGLAQRLDDVTSRASIVAGNGSDDYLERESAVSDRLKVLDNEVKNAQRRLNELAHNVVRLEQLREEVRSRFPDLTEPNEAHTESASHGTPPAAAAS
jgi:chromosome segregation ATPase